MPNTRSGYVRQINTQVASFNLIVACPAEQQYTARLKQKMYKAVCCVVD